MYSQTGTSHRSSEMEDCIKNCSDCHDVCLETVTHCLQKGGRHAEVQHIRQPDLPHEWRFHASRVGFTSSNVWCLR
jgi:hypothetical protein